MLLRMLCHALFARSTCVSGEARHAIQVMGRVASPMPNALFRVELENGQSVMAHVATDLRMRSVRLLPGDRVRVELSPFDLTRGRIIEIRRD